ncbi:MAG: hypothetical protein KDC61_13350, partial [Saprospiraceae bacterium]|nr:hypothetical protein [Saprospiraceae bacterium]
AHFQDIALLQMLKSLIRNIEKRMTHTVYAPQNHPQKQERHPGEGWRILYAKSAFRFVHFKKGGRTLVLRNEACPNGRLEKDYIRGGGPRDNVRRFC